MDHWTEEIVKTISSISGKYSSYEIFSDWVKCMALSLSNSSSLLHSRTWTSREEEYKATMDKYTADEQKKILDMTGMLTLALEDDMRDVLGDVYMAGGMGSKSTGQFFTPFHVSYMTARLSLENQFGHISQNDRIELNEPSCGGGGMIIAVAKVLQEHGENYQKKMRVTTQDLDWKAVYMCYVQLSFLGINAVVVQGDTLTESFASIPGERKLYTPARMGMLI